MPPTTPKNVTLSSTGKRKNGLNSARGKNALKQKHERRDQDKTCPARDKVPAWKHVKEEDDANRAEKADDMGQQPPGRGKRPNKVIIESDRKCAQGERSEERQRVVRLAPEEQCSDQPVP